MSKCSAECSSDGATRRANADKIRPDCYAQRNRQARNARPSGAEREAKAVSRTHYVGLLTLHRHDIATRQLPLERVKQNSLSGRDRIISQPDSPTWGKHASYHRPPFPSPRLQGWSEQPAKGDGDVRHSAFIGWRRDRPTHKARRVIPYERSGRNSLLRHPNLGYTNQYSGTDSRT
jgi:hypothetical protein